MKVLSVDFKLNNAYLQQKSKTKNYGYTNNAIFAQKIWPEMMVSNKEIRNAFIVSSVEKFNKRLAEYLLK